MEIKPLKKIKPVKQSEISTDDFLRQPKEPVKPLQPGEMRTEFVKQQIFIDGKEVSQLILEAAEKNPLLLSKIANELEKFKKDSLKKKKKKKFIKWGSQSKLEYSEEQLGVIFALCDAFIQRITEMIKQRYDQTKDGLSVRFDEEGQLILNGMNIHALVDQCRQNPNPKSQTYLKGIRSRLHHVLENKANNRNYDRIREVILQLFVEIDQILNE